MSLEQTTELYASVLHQLLPEGLHDTAQTTLVADDIYAHAKVLAQADIDAHRLLKVLEEVPPELLPEYEAEYGLPLKCSINAGRTIEERIEILRWVRSTRNVLNRAYFDQVLKIFGVELFEFKKFRPMQCTAPCNAPVNTEQLRYKIRIVIPDTAPADMDCIIQNYFPSYLRIDVLKVPLLFKTSKLYPVITEDHCTTSFSVNSMMLRTILKETGIPAEPIQCGFGVSYIQLRENYQKVSLKPEEISTDFGIASLTLKQVHKSTSMNAETLSNGFNVSKIILKDVLLSNSLNTEFIEYGFAITSIKLV